ncbi:hypothetical protein INT45_004411 [Circinella minor]|uniref:Uncharacterized protein n=1 Tax=Circinella minor TaxID=1195481 RepID=A0A8H7SAG1_9FUNG|nr:hypothetical protein INT45_004411 [Circinella minor]
MENEDRTSPGVNKPFDIDLVSPVIDVDDVDDNGDEYIDSFKDDDILDEIFCRSRRLGLPRFLCCTSKQVSSLPD